MVNRALDVVLLGPPGAGKGTQAKRLASAFELLHISTGDLLRDEVARGSALGEEAKAFMNRGELVPDEVVGRMLYAHLHSQSAAGGCVFDGYPRTTEQAALLDGLLAELGRRVDAALYLDVADDEVLRRLAGRRSCATCGAVDQTDGDRCSSCGGELVEREDDAPDVVRERLAVYRRKTEPLLSLFRDRGLLRDVNGVGSRDDVFASLREAARSVRR